MHVIASLAGAALILFAAVSAPGATTFDPAFEALVVVNLSVPDRVETSARLRSGAITAHAGPQRFPIQPQFTEAASRDLAGRAPRWFQLTLEPTVLDSIVVRWDSVELLIDEHWQPPVVPPPPTTLHVGREVLVGEVIVLNLSWDPDAQVDAAPDWRPSIRPEELVEPPPGARLYVTEEHSGIVAVHERVGGRMVRGLPAGGQPRDLAWDPLRQRLYVSVAGRDELLSIDPLGRETIVRVPLSFGADPTRVLYSADRQRIAVLAPGRDMLFLFSAGSLQELAKVRVGRDPVAMAEDPQSGRIYVTSRTSGQVDVVDPETARVVSTFSQPDTPAEIVRLQSGRFAIGQYRGRRLDVIDPVSGAIQSTVDLCGPVSGLVLVARLDRVFAVSNFCREITILRPEEQLELGSLKLDEMAGLPSLGPQESVIYLPLPKSAQVMILPVDGSARARRVDTGPGPWRVVAP